MSENKKYYWLKLKKDFFKRHDIQIIESMDNGKEYVLFYLKLLAESVSHNGELRFSKTIPYNDKMLATITNTNIDIVRSAIKILSELGLIQIMSDDTIYMEEVNKLLGAETEWAEKKREYRQRQKQLQNGTKEGQKKTLSDKSKRLELELELEKELKKEEQPGKPDYLSLFNIWYKSYPNKVGKEKAKTKYIARIKKDIGLHDIMLTALLNQIDWRDRAEAENIDRSEYKIKEVFIPAFPNPEKWINQAYWENEIQEFPRLGEQKRIEQEKIDKQAREWI